LGCLPILLTCVHTQTKAFSYHLAVNFQLFYVSGMHLMKFTKMHYRAVEYFCVLKCYVWLSGQPLSKYSSWIGGVAKPCSKNVLLVSIVVITVWIDLVDQCIKVWIRSQRTLGHKFLATRWTLFIPTPKCSDNTFLAKPGKIMLTIYSHKRQKTAKNSLTDQGEGQKASYN